MGTHAPNRVVADTSLRRSAACQPEGANNEGPDRMLVPRLGHLPSTYDRIRVSETKIPSDLPEVSRFASLRTGDLLFA